MTKISCFIHGVYPRSSVLAQATRDFERRRVQENDVIRVRKKDIASLLALQKEADFLYIEDGKLSWQDIFRPIVETSKGITVGALTRWFDNNSFFRQPIFNGKQTVNTEKLKNFFPKITPAKMWKVTLPSPYSFAKLSNSLSGESFEELLEKTTAIIALLVSHLSKKGVSVIQLNEPSIPYYGASKQELSLFRKSIIKVALEKGNAKLGAHFYFGDAAPFVNDLINTEGIDMIGIDFYKTSLSDLPKNVPFAIIAGIIDGRNSLLENKKALQSFIKDVVKRLNPPAVYLSNNSDLEFLPETVARQKLLLLGEVTRSMQKL